MELPERVERYKAIEDYRKRPLIVYATSTRTNVQAQMAGDVVREFIDQMDAVGNAKKVDVLIHSTGGDALAAWKLMSLLRERFSSVDIMVPHMAFSAATLFALGANRIHMHPHASLGPIDPQIRMKLKEGGHRLFSFEDVGAFIRFLTEEAKVSDQQFLAPVIAELFNVVDPIVVGAGKRASELSTDVGERLLRMHMTDEEGAKKARRIAEDLNKSFFDHSDAVSRTRARDLKLQIGDPDPALEELMWAAYLGLEAYMELKSPFNPLHHYLANGGDQAVRATPPLVVPPNAPPQLVQQVWQQVVNNALAQLAQPAVEVEYQLINAVVESVRVASEFRTVGRITAARAGGGKIELTLTDREQGWRTVDDGSVH